MTRSSDVNEHGICADCDDPLSAEEAHYYVWRCETCEAFWLERLKAWKAGAKDEEFDRMFERQKATRP